MASYGMLTGWIGLHAPPCRNRADGDDDGRLGLLMRAGQDGNTAAYRALLRSCVPIIAASLSHHGLTAEQSDRVVHETLVALHRLRRTYDPGQPFLPWLHGISEERASDVTGRQGGRDHAAPRGHKALHAWPVPRGGHSGRVGAADGGTHGRGRG